MRVQYFCYIGVIFYRIYIKNEIDKSRQYIINFQETIEYGLLNFKPPNFSLATPVTAAHLPYSPVILLF
jgi:hypothetical protein